MKERKRRNAKYYNWRYTKLRKKRTLGIHTKKKLIMKKYIYYKGCKVKREQGKTKDDNWRYTKSLRKYKAQEIHTSKK